MARPWERKFLGFSFTAKESQTERIAPKSMVRLQGASSGNHAPHTGHEPEGVIEDLNVHRRGRHGYLGFWQTFFSCSLKACWIRRKLWCVMWKQWKRGRTRLKELPGARRQRGSSGIYRRAPTWPGAAQSESGFVHCIPQCMLCRDRSPSMSRRSIAKPPNPRPARTYMHGGVPGAKGDRPPMSLSDSI